MRLWLRRCGGRAAAVVAAAAVGAGAAAAGTLAQLRIHGYGGLVVPLEVELFDDKPATVANFVRLIESGAFRNMFFHRLVPGFVMQGGGYRLTPDLTGVEEVPHFGPVSNEFAVGTLRSNADGTLAMAKLPGDPDSATCQFFINLADNSANLDVQNGGFTVFGRVLSDPMGLLWFWNSLSHGNGIVNVGDPFGDLPVNYAGSLPPMLDNLIYCEVSLLKVAVSNGPSGRVISWPAAVGMTNVLERATHPAGPWTPVWTTNAASLGTIHHEDSSSAPVRLYRVRVQP